MAEQDDDDGVAPRLVTRADVQRAAESAGVPEAASALWEALAAAPAVQAAEAGPALRSPSSSSQAVLGRRTTAAEVAVYTGGVIALLAMSVFAGTGWAQYGAGAGLAIVGSYLVVFVVVAELLRRRASRSGSGRTAAGVVAAVAVCTVPLVVYAACSVMGVLPSPSGYIDDWDAYTAARRPVWIAMELSATAAAAAAWLRHRTSFLLAPLVAASGWLVLDVGDALTGGDTSDGSALGRQVAAWMLTAGLAGAALALDRRGRRVEAFWPHLGSLLAAATAVMLLEGGGTPTALAFLALGVLAIAIGVLLDRRVHFALGGLYLVGALSYFAFDVFGDTVLFAPALALIGLLVLLGGVWLARRPRGARADSARAPSSH
ncbi:hypothetical protein SAMN06264364_12650 [Quadrisphaera granulorum]|uniref:Membrane protein DUF2157 n=1 Tax=Quadrisphaera granulorum TaxID=317664 RepID=A0A316AHE4_9ACTN|nr:hypothetical protein [Quadrisphaera granulorum]PWJ49297.1 hypothetical protein BXY45_12650 [Quadrisphaera granulorum]SZE98214.1 hypothetical protein SAMN06264364_12650 [Quadrisphaera granulorum]